jgi:Flp pilus assembly protein TadD
VQDRSKPLRKTRIGLFYSGPAAAFYGLMADDRMDEAFRLAEWSLRRYPENTALLPPYVHLAQATQREAQCRALLAEAVQRRPVEIEWHRMHQQLRSRREELPALLAEYDGLLKVDPENSELLYLRGRLCTRLHEAIPLFQRALEHNPSNAFAHFALAVCRQSTADWSVAQGSLARAVELMPHEGAFAESLFVTRLAQDDRAALEAELRATLQAEPADYDAAWRLCQVLLVQNQRPAAESVVADCARQLQTGMPDEADEIILGLRIKLAYAAGDFEAVLDHAAEMSPQAAGFYRIRALAESGNTEAAASLAEADQWTFQDPFDTLAFSLACARAGQPALADTWRTRALSQLAEWRGDSAVAAELLERDAPVSLADALDLFIGAPQKALLLVILAERAGTEATAFRDLARRLNVVREYPWHLVNQIAEAVPAAATKPAN